VTDRPVVVCFPFVGDDVGGSHVSAVGLIRALDPARVRPLVVLHRTDGPLARFLAAEGVAFEAAPPRAPVEATAGAARAALRLVFRVAPALSAFMRRRGVEVVHTNDGRIHAAWSVAGRLAGARVLWHHRGDPTARGVNVLAPVVADRIVTVSRFARPARPILPIDRRWSVIHSPFDHPPPVDRAAARAAVAAAVSAPADARFIGFFGQFIERKRPFDVVDIVAAFAARRRDRPVTALFFGADAAGRPPLEAATRARAEALGVADRCVFMGFRRPVEPWMAGVDVLVAPATSEPFGRTLIEAMLLGTPVVAANHGGNPEAVVDGATGFLPPPADPPAFVEPIARLLDDPALAARIAGAASAEARARYGVEAHVAAIEAIYHELRRSPRPRRAAGPDGADALSERTGPCEPKTSTS
jgi:glycosyltransferase involved in cell wall biosynthesis